MGKKTKFIYHHDTEIVTLTTTTMMPTIPPVQNVTLRTVTLGPLGFPMLPTLPPLPDIGALNLIPEDVNVPLLAGLVGFFPLWFLIGKQRIYRKSK